jgi:hypothetical protein
VVFDPYILREYLSDSNVLFIELAQFKGHAEAFGFFIIVC